MIRSRAKVHLTSILDWVGKQSKCLNQLYDPEKALTEEFLLIMRQLPGDLLEMESSTHLFANECRLDRSSTSLLVMKYKEELSGCLWLYKKVISSENRQLITGHAEVCTYLLELNNGLDDLLEQLSSELKETAFPAHYSLVPQSFYASATGTLSSCPDSPNGLLQFSPQGTSSEVFSEASFQGGHLFSSAAIPPPLQDPAAALEPLLAGILSKLTSSELQEQEMKTQITQILDVLDTKLTRLDPQKKKRGRKSQKAELSFQEQIYVLLLANLDLLLIKYIGKQSSCEFLALACGGNVRDARGHLNFYRREENGSTEDEKYELEGKFPELKKRALNYLGPLPGLILKLVRKS